MNLKTEVNAFLIWRYARQFDWDVTSVEIARALELSAKTVSNICHHRGWSKRMPREVPKWGHNYDAPTRRPATRLAEVRSILELPSC